MKILAIVPAYNEANNIHAVIEDLRCFDGDVLVVNDGSTDDTAAVAKSLGAHVVSHPFNLGIGGTVQTGIREHDYDMAIQFDGDGQHRADQIFKIVELVENGEADLVIGSRTLPGGYKMGITRWMGSRIFHLLMRGRLSGNSSITRRKSAYYMLKVTLALVVDAMRGKMLPGES